MHEHDIVKRVYAAKGDTVAADSLIRDYLPYIKSETYKAIGRIPVDGRDDELSIAMFGFYEAIETYSKLRGAFLKYAATVIRHKIIDYQRKEKRHLGHSSMDAPAFDDGEDTLSDRLPDDQNAYDDMHYRDATQAEIEELTAELSSFGVSMTDISENCPKQNRTLTACQMALKYAMERTDLIATMKRTKRLPIAELTLGSGVERKTLERHRKYLLALIVIYSNGYEIIRGHLKQVLAKQKEEVFA